MLSLTIVLRPNFSLKVEIFMIIWSDFIKNNNSYMYDIEFNNHYNNILLSIYKYIYLNI